jgi:hypothetical protein
MIHIYKFWLFFGNAPIRLSTVITLGLIFVLVVWKFRNKGWLRAIYNGIVAGLFTLFLYEVIFNITGKFPPTGNLPPWGVGLMILSLILGLVQAFKHYRFHRMAIVFLSAFIVDWIFWIILGFPFNFPITNPIDLTAEVFNITSKLLLPLGYFTGLTISKK